MKYETYSVKIEGVTPLLQHRFSEKAEQADAKGGVRMVKHEDREPREVAQSVAYMREDGTFYFPGACIGAMLCEVASNHKQKGNRKSMRFVVPASVMCVEESIAITNGDGGPAKHFEVDSRPVVIPSTKGRIMRHRPRFDKWGAAFHLRINVDLIEPKFVNLLMVQGGEINGLGDYRPQKRGPFGTFILTDWKKIK